MNEPFNILVVTNSRRQATQKTQTEFFICFYCWSFVQAERDRRQGAGGKEHRTQDMRAVGSWNGQAISECRPEQSRIDKVNESLATYLATRIAEAASASRCEGVASPPCIPAGPGIHVPGEIQGTRPFLAQAVQ